VQTQRAERGKNRLSTERVWKLNELGFVWSTTWEERLDELARYKDEHGDCSVPSKSYGPLGHWVTSQRTARRKGKLSEERVKKLDDLGFVWVTKQIPKPPSLTREKHLDELAKKCKAVRRNVHVPHAPKSRGPSGNCVEQEREGKLSEERVRELDDLDFDGGTTSPTWQDRYNELVMYKREHGDCNVPPSHGSLGLWVTIQRKNRARLLSKERVQLLNEIGLK